MYILLDEDEISLVKCFFFKKLLLFIKKYRTDQEGHVVCFMKYILKQQLEKSEYYNKYQSENMLKWYTYKFICTEVQIMDYT